MGGFWRRIPLATAFATVMLPRQAPTRQGLLISRQILLDPASRIRHDPRILNRVRLGEERGPAVELIATAQGPSSVGSRN